MTTTQNTKEEKPELLKLAMQQSKASQLENIKRRDARFDKINPQAKNAIPEKYARYEFNMYSLEHYDFILSLRQGLIPRPQSCPNCGKKSGKFILKVSVPIEDIENNVAEYQELVKDRTIVYTRKKQYENATHQVIGLWSGKYHTQEYGYFCKLRCCATYANRKFEGII
tara:strand:+ start:22006 stop:22512 length:507 start_codon:yes stop_codon:yes gene_type:complete